MPSLKSTPLALLLVGATCFGVVGCTRDTPKPTSSSVPFGLGQPEEIKPDDNGWVRAGELFKTKGGEVKIWKYGEYFIQRLFFLDDGGYINGNITVGPTSTIYSAKIENLSKPFLMYNCNRGDWDYFRGHILDNMIDRLKDEMRTYLKVDGKYTGLKPWNKKPWPTTGYDPSKNGWKEKFVGKSGHGINQITGKDNEIAGLIARSKEAILVSGSKDEKVMFKFEFDTPPDEINKKELCEFTIDGKAIIPAS